MLLSSYREVIPVPKENGGRGMHVLDFPESVATYKKRRLPPSGYDVSRYAGWRSNWRNITFDSKL